jgi:hypothetical protein
MNIYGLAPISGACHWYRIREPLRGLAGLGHMTAFGELFDDTIVTRYDTILTHIPHGDDLTLALRYLFDEGQHRLIVDIDDNIWAYPKETDHHDYWNTGLHREQVEQNLRLAHLITTPSHVLADYIAFRLSLPRAKIAVLPNFVPQWVNSLPRTTPQYFTVGYQGAPQRLHQADLDIIQEELYTFLRLCRDARLLFFGQPHDLTGAGPFTDRIDFIPWTPDVPEYYRSLHKMTVGIAPLQRSIFTDCKSAVRAAEFHGLGIPGIYSKAPPYLGWVSHRVTGYLVNIATDWRKHLIKLYRSPELVSQLSGNARRQGSDWTTERNAVLWEHAFQGSGPGVTVPSPLVRPTSSGNT